jgi:large subunit ribosomal protein L3
MIQTILGKKIDQTQKFLSDGTRVPVTQVHVPDNTVVQVNKAGNAGSVSIQIGMGVRKKPAKPLLGHAKKAGLGFVPLLLKEVKIKKADEDSDEQSLPKAGDILQLDKIFKPGDIVNVTGISKGKGFAGVVKRHGFRGGPKTHGQSDRLRAPGSIGQTTTPGRVYKGKRMAGRMGQDRVTIKNLMILSVDSENKTLHVSGLIPGVKKSIVYITLAGESKKFVPLYVNEPKKESKTDEIPPATSEVTSATDVSDKKTAEEPKIEVKAKPSKIEKVEDSKKGEKQGAQKS